MYFPLHLDNLNSLYEPNTSNTSHVIPFRLVHFPTLNGTILKRNCPHRTPYRFMIELQLTTSLIDKSPVMALYLICLYHHMKHQLTQTSAVRRYAPSRLTQIMCDTKPQACMEEYFSQAYLPNPQPFLSVRTPNGNADMAWTTRQGSLRLNAGILSVNY